jgi:preprotein translocase subunit YajC
MSTQTQQEQKMVANLQPGDRIQFAGHELGLPDSVIESTVVGVRKLPEGWHEVITVIGALKLHLPTDKYAIV